MFAYNADGIRFIPGQQSVLGTGAPIACPQKISANYNQRRNDKNGSPRVQPEDISLRVRPRRHKHLG